MQHTGVKPPFDGLRAAADESSLPLGVLEFLSVRPGPSATAARTAGLGAARLADRLGYRRLWVPEHHARGVPSTNPVLLLPALGALTSRIRLGTAVALLRIRDPYLLAEDLVTAAYFCRDRLDVGLGRGDVRGAGTEVLPRHTEDELDQASATVIELVRHGNGWIDPAEGSVQCWMNGAGTRSGELAAQLGYHYCHGLFFNPDRAAARRPLGAHAEALPSGRRAVAVAMVVNDDAARAEADASVSGVHVLARGTAAHCSEAVLELLSDELVDEVVITEQSSRPEDHQAALTAIAALVGAELAPVPGCLDELATAIPVVA